jgi:hypothetical protein
MALLLRVVAHLVWRLRTQQFLIAVAFLATFWCLACRHESEECSRVPSISSPLASLSSVGFDSKFEPDNTAPSSAVDNPWFLAHRMLALGPNHPVRLDSSGKNMPVLQFLATKALRPNGEELFDRVEGGARWASTDSTPLQVLQDHPNQFLAYMLMAAAEYDIAAPPPGISEERWQSLIDGAWLDYRLDTDPSWTLIVYVLAGDAIRGVSAQQVARRIDEMVDALAEDRPSRFAFACAGAHANDALALYLRSPHATRDSGRRDRVKRCLDARFMAFLSTLSVDRDLSERSLPQVIREASANGHALEWICLYASADQLNSLPMRTLFDDLTADLRRIRAASLENQGGVYHAWHGAHRYLGASRAVSQSRR